MKGIKYKCAAGLVAWFSMAVFTGCSLVPKEQVKTIILPPQENQMVDAKNLRINHIQEYTGSGYSEDTIHLAWGEPGTDLLYQLYLTNGDYIYETIDAQTDAIKTSFLVEDRAMDYITIAPGGRYLTYEVWEDTPELVVFFPEKEVKMTLRTLEEWELGIYSYVWSDDGRRLFSWQNGDAGDPYVDWEVTCYEMIENEADGFYIRTSQFQMDGHGLSWRMVLPNADGSEVYVREQLLSYNDSKAEEYDRNINDMNLNHDAQAAIGPDAAMGSQIAYNWLLHPDAADIYELPEYSMEPIQPVKYTKAGLFYQNEEQALFLVEDLEGYPSRSKEVMPSDTERLLYSVYVCENGDHVFLGEFVDDTDIFQVSGFRITDGKMEGEPTVLYKDYSDNIREISILGDQAVVLIRGEYTDLHLYYYKITALEY